MYATENGHIKIVNKLVKKLLLTVPDNIDINMKNEVRKQVIVYG